MSYLSQLKNRQISAKEFLAKSVGYLSRKLGVTVSDQKVDEAVAALDRVTDDVETALAAYLSTHVPGLPVAIATAATTAALNVIDAAIAGAGNVIKENN